MGRGGGAPFEVQHHVATLLNFADRVLENDLREGAARAPRAVIAGGLPSGGRRASAPELQESAQMLMELNNAQRVGSVPDLSSILNTWRERLPNTWEELPAWNDLISWRNHMFSHINNVLGRLAEHA